MSATEISLVRLQTVLWVRTYFDHLLSVLGWVHRWLCEKYLYGTETVTMVVGDVQVPIQRVR